MVLVYHYNWSIWNSSELNCKKLLNGTPISNSILFDFLNGSFYTFSIALVASVLGPIFINLINSERLPFRTLKTFTIIISIFYLFITGIIYAAVQANDIRTIMNCDASVDYTQLIFYLIAIFIAIYGYSILRLESSGLNFANIDDPPFNEQDDVNVEEIIQEGKDIEQDENEIAL